MTDNQNTPPSPNAQVSGAMVNAADSILSHSGYPGIPDHVIAFAIAAALSIDTKQYNPWDRDCVAEIVDPEAFARPDSETSAGKVLRIQRIVKAREKATKIAALYRTAPVKSGESR